MYASADSLFISSKSEDLKDGSKMLIKGLSLIMAAFIFVLKIPMIMTLLQGYLCDENLDYNYTGVGIVCNSFNN